MEPLRNLEQRSAGFLEELRRSNILAVHGSRMGKSIPCHILPGLASCGSRRFFFR